MFNLFKRSSNGAKVIDKVWLSQQAKWNACVQMVKLDPSILLVAWFEETFEEITRRPGLSQNLIRADNVSYDKTIGRMVIIAEHYRLPQLRKISSENFN